MTIQTKDNYEPRHCFKEQAHEDHVWDVHADDGSTDNDVRPRVLRYYCNGAGTRPSPEGWDLTEGDIFAVATNGLGETLPGDGETPNAELAHRPEYGDPLENMREQNAMFMAYLSGRTPTAFDTTIFQVLIKLHRMGKMPDYADNYHDVKGYLRLAEGLVGDEMIEAATVSEYRNIKANGGEEKVIEIRLPFNASRTHVVGCVIHDPNHGGRCLVRDGHVPRHPYDRADEYFTD